MYDCAIIGGGPAGVSAALNLKILGKNFIWFSSQAFSKKASLAEKVKNYPGLYDVTGEDFMKKLLSHAESMGIELNKNFVSGVYDTGGKFTLLTSDGECEAKTVILCTGVKSGGDIDGEETFLGRGVSYCATCDGMLYKDKTIAVLCTDKAFEHEILYLCNLAKKAYVMPLYAGYEINSPNAGIILKKPVKLTGGMRLEKVNFKDGSLEVDGMFILREAVSPSALVHGLKCDGGHIVVDRACRTGIAGIFAAGDCTGRPYQYAKSVGEGNVAAHSAVEYLANTKDLL